MTNILTDTEEAKFWSQIDRSGDCWLWTSTLDNFGYGVIRFMGRQYRAHRLTWMLLVGPIPEGKCVLHNCPAGDNPACCNPAHCFLGTRADNARDRDAKRREPAAWRGAKSYFTPNHIRAIRKMADDGAGVNQIALKFHVSIRTVYNIIRRETWRDVA